MTRPNDFTLPGHSRVWIYQASRFFEPEEINRLTGMINEFVSSWHAHGTGLSAEIRVLHNLFIVVAVDEMVAKASGCSIDKSVRLIKDIERELDISLTGRTTVAYFDPEKNIKLIHFNDLKEEIRNGNIDERQLMFNNLVSTLDDLRSNWILPIKNSWLSKIPA